MQLLSSQKVKTKKQVVLYSGIVGLISIFSSVLFTMLFVSWIHPEENPFDYIIPAILVPLFVAPPIGYYLFNLVHKLETAKRQLEHLSQHDSLTNLYNRGHFWKLSKERLATAQSDGTILAVILLDIDDFKLINDTYGHPVGDQVLKHIARTIETCVRQGDILGRYGGEEFALVLNDCDYESARARAESICETVRESNFMNDGKVLPISASVGVSTTEEHDSFEVLINLADEAMYRAKYQGKDQVCISKIIRPDSTSSTVANSSTSSENFKLTA